MTDAALAEFIGIADDPRWPAAIARIDPGRRAVLERMADLVVEVELYSKGLGPRPTGVLLDFNRGIFR